MSRAKPTDAERAMNANAKSRVQQGARDDKATRRNAARRHGTADPPGSTDLTGPGGDPAEGKR